MTGDREGRAAPAGAGSPGARHGSGWPTALPDVALLAAYQRTTGEPGDAEADALLAEIVRRGLDV